MPLSHPATPIDPDTSRILDQLKNHLERLPEHFEEVRQHLEHGITPGELRGITPADYASLYRMGCQLCDRGDFHHALIIGLQLVFHDPGSSRYAFLAASCLQRTGRLQLAALLYARALDLDESHAAAAYRLGECLRGLGKPVEARAIFEQSIDLSRGDCARRELMLLAEQALSNL